MRIGNGSGLGMRRLRARAATFDPSKLPGFVAWGTAESTTKDGSNNVTQWTDLGSGHYNLTPPGNKPIWTASATPSGLAAVDFQAANSQWLRNQTLTLPQPFAVYLAFKPKTWVNSQQLFSDTTGNFYGAIYQNVAPNQVVMYAGSAASIGQVSISAWHRLCCIFDGASSQFRLDDGGLATDAVGLGGLVSGFNLGAFSSGSFFGDYYLAAWAIFSGHPAAGDVDTMMAGLKTKYGL